MSNKKRDYRHKLAHFYTIEYDAVFVEDLSARGMLESFENACHVVAVPKATTKMCATCGVWALVASNGWSRTWV